MANSPALLNSLTLRYVLALTMVGSLATAAFLFLHKVILRHENEAAVVNIAGRQRMLSQRITLAVSQLVLAEDAADRRLWTAELLSALDLMENSHRALTQGDRALGIPPDTAAVIGDMYAEPPLDVSQQVTDFVADGRLMAAADRPAGRPDPAYLRILARSPAVLSGLDDVVRRYQLSVEHRVRTLERLETAAWLATLLVLLLEALLIFRPMVHRVLASLKEEEDKRAAAEQQAMSDQRRTEALIDTIADAVVIIDQEGEIQTFSPSAERMFGWQRAEAVGKDFGILMPEPFRQHHQEFLRRYQAGYRPQSVGIEAIGQRRDGSTFPLELALGAWRDGEHRFFTAVVRDITQRKALEESMRRAQKMEVVGQLSGGVAHDFNNLLGIITGNLEILESGLGGHPRLLKRIEVAQHAAARGADLTRKLLSFSGGRTSQPKEVDVNALIRSSSGLLDRLQADRVAVSLKLTEDLMKVRIDPGEFEDALLNLALNARDAMPDGGTLAIETANRMPAAPDEPSSVVVSVTDSGIGMSPDLQRKIFEPFFTSKPPGKGTGLGLATVDRFVRRSGGVIDVRSEPGQGTTFQIRLPVVTVAHSVVPGQPTELRGGNETLLVVDDESDLLSVLCTQLESLGYRCLPAKDGAEALSILEADPLIALLLTDVIMPGPFDGVELASRALARRSDLKVLLSTGFAGRTRTETRRLLPHAEVIGKPYLRDELARKVRALLDDKRLHI